VVRPYSLVIGSMQRKQVPEPLALACAACSRTSSRVSQNVALCRIRKDVSAVGRLRRQGGITPVPVSREHPIRRHERNGKSCA
jgi:hypothetical protein